MSIPNPFGSFGSGYDATYSPAVNVKNSGGVKKSGGGSSSASGSTGSRPGSGSNEKNLKRICKGSRTDSLMGSKLIQGKFK